MKQKSTQTLPMLAAAAMALVSLANAAEVKVPIGREKPAGFGNYHWPRERPAPLVDHPLRDPSIARGPDGWYYLTGTDGTPSAPEHADAPFANNDGIRLWKSKDLESWEPLGKVWDCVTYPPRQNLDIPWWRFPTVTPGQAFSPLRRGVVAPEIHYLKDTFHIVFSIGGDGVGILKSTSGKPEGPYALLGPEEKTGIHRGSVPIVQEGGSPSLFADDDGTVYLLWGRGFIAPLSEDLARITAKPRQVVCEYPDMPLNAPPTVGHDGFSLFKGDGKYWLTAANVRYRDQFAASDVYVASSDTLFGPYGQRRWMIPRAGQTTVFTAPNGKLYATYCGADEAAAFTDRAGIVPLIWDTEPPEGSKEKWKFPRIAAGVHTERGVWHEVRPIIEHTMRDVTCILAPDGWYYYSGSFDDAHFAGRLPVLRSKDLANWEEVPVTTLDDPPWLTPESKALRKENAAKNPRTLDNKFMDCELHHVKGTFHYIYSLYGLKNARLAAAPEGMAHEGTCYMRSTSGKIEGPWEHLGPLKASQGSFFEDDDGTVYLCAGRHALGKMRPDMTGGRDGDLGQALPADGSHAFCDVGAYLRKCVAQMWRHLRLLLLRLWDTPSAGIP